MAFFESSFSTSDESFYEKQATGIRPVVFDIVGPDLETSILPGDLKLVLHVNPKTMSFSYSKIIERIQTLGGFVEQHWGEGAQTISFEMTTGAIMRLYSGLSSVTGGGSYNAGGNRRETIAYDKYLDLLAFFNNNGTVKDLQGNIVFQGQVKVSFDGISWFGWFQNFNVSETAETPYQFTVTTEFTVAKEIMTLRTIVENTQHLRSLGFSGTPVDTFKIPSPTEGAGSSPLERETEIIPEGSNDSEVPPNLEGEDLISRFATSFNNIIGGEDG